MANIIISKNPSLKLHLLYPMNCAKKQIWQLKHITNIIKMVRTLKQTKQICKLRPLNLLTSSTTS
ncbi:hypothetical protein BANRA_05191 [Escherichia coli]|nr:hypothetical protein BANRA_05191 [Escherichia coli]